jgi:hypothetical protein
MIGQDVIALGVGLTGVIDARTEWPWTPTIPPSPRRQTAMRRSNAGTSRPGAASRLIDLSSTPEAAPLRTGAVLFFRLSRRGRRTLS